jgi:hypothetical protein
MLVLPHHVLLLVTLIAMLLAETQHPLETGGGWDAGREERQADVLS